jgi:endonuclease YncB( thermonuclease family)
MADGDTFTLLTADKKQVKIRLHGVDCPERKAPFGSQAKEFAGKLIFGKAVTAKKTATDRYGRTVAVYLPDGRVFNEELLKAGLAWHYKKHDRNPLWSKMEAAARKGKKGLWAQSNPIPPWEFRKAQRNIRKQRKVKEQY